jgi:hypothetical protein
MIPNLNSDLGAFENQMLRQVKPIFLPCLMRGRLKSLNPYWDIRNAPG